MIYYNCGTIQSTFSQTYRTSLCEWTSSCEGNAGRAVAAASWRKGAKASQAWRSLRTTHGGISSLALGLSGPHIWWDFILARGRRASLAHGRSGPSNDGICKTWTAGAAKFSGECCHRIMERVMRMFLFTYQQKYNMQYYSE